MKKFQFRLEAVERHRKLTEQEKQVWLAKCVAKLRSIEQQLLELDMKEVQARREFSALGGSSGGKPPSSARFWVLDQFIQGQKIRRVDLKRDLQSQEQEVSLAYQQYLKARQERKIMEKLREKRLTQHKEILAKQETRFQDEQYVTRAKAFSRQEEADE